MTDLALALLLVYLRHNDRPRPKDDSRRWANRNFDGVENMLDGHRIAFTHTDHHPAPFQRPCCFAAVHVPKLCPAVIWWAMNRPGIRTYPVLEAAQ